MTYEERLLAEYEQSLREDGVSEIGIRDALAAFYTGVMAGIQKGDKVKEERMLELIRERMMKH